MSQNNRKDDTNHPDQLFTDNINECTRDIEFHVFRSHLVTLKKKMRSHK